MTVSLTDDVHAVQVNNSTRQQVKVVLLLTNNHRVSRIVSALNKTAVKMNSNKIACVLDS